MKKRGPPLSAEPRGQMVVLGLYRHSCRSRARPYHGRINFLLMDLHHRVVTTAFASGP